MSLHSISLCLITRREKQKLNRDQMKKTASWQENAHIPMAVLGDP